MIEKIKDNSVIFGKNKDKLEILKALNSKSLFLSLAFFDYNADFITFNHKYYFYLANVYKIKYDLAKKIKNYFAYIDTNQTYHSKRLNELATIKKDLLAKKIIVQDALTKYKDRPIYSINNSPIPIFFPRSSVTPLKIIQSSNKEVKLYKTETAKLASMKAYQEVVRLLEEDISIDDIVIINTTSEDDFNLTKLFNDSKIPLTINKPVNLASYPEVIKLIHIIKEFGYNRSKDYLKELIQTRNDAIYLKPIVQIYNNFTDKDLSENIEILINMIKSKTVSPTKYLNTVNIYHIDDFKYSDSKHYIIMNYNDNSLPKRANKSHYLNDLELKEIYYINHEVENKYLEEYYQNLLNSIDNLSLIYSENAEEELRLSRLKLSRNVITEDYKYLVQNHSYFNALDQLEFAKTKYDLETFYIKDENYNRLYKTYHKRILRYLHEFNGINQSDLAILLKRNNSITPYKIESYYKCEFQYLLQNLLKIGEFETNINQYLGNLSHKVLEELSVNDSIDSNKIIDEFPGFPEAISYKEKTYKEAIKKEMDVLVPIIKDFHQNSKFKTIKPEIKFRFPFTHDENFLISGIIDKVMIKENKDGTEYFALIDYKLSSKDFKLDEFNKNLKLQLPMYLYAYQELNKTKAKPIGFFYQTTSLGKLKSETNAINKNFSLKGIALEDQDILEDFNPGLELVNGIQITKTGNLRKSNRLVPASEFNQLEKEIEAKIISMIENLKSGKFDINPLPAYGSNKDSESCKYCEYAAICYNKNKKRGDA